MRGQLAGEGPGIGHQPPQHGHVLQQCGAQHVAFLPAHVGEAGQRALQRIAHQRLHGLLPGFPALELHQVAVGEEVPQGDLQRVLQGPAGVAQQAGVAAQQGQVELERGGPLALGGQRDRAVQLAPLAAGLDALLEGLVQVCQAAGQPQPDVQVAPVDRAQLHRAAPAGGGALGLPEPGHGADHGCSLPVRRSSRS